MCAGGGGGDGEGGGGGGRGRCVNGSELDWVSECVFGRWGRRGVREWERARLDG